MSEVHGSIAIPEADASIPATTTEELDTAVADLRDNAKRWVDTSLAERIAMLEQAIRDSLDAAPAWALAEAVLRQINRDSPHMGEPWLAGPYATLHNLRRLRDTLRDIQQSGRPQPPGIRVRDNGQVVVDAFPLDWTDQVSLPGFKGEIRVQPGVNRAQVEARMGRVYRGDIGDGSVGLVLGAGNNSSIPAMDALYKLFAENQVVLIKMNPVNEVVGPHIAQAFRVFIDAGVLRIVYGGIDVGVACCQHEGVDAIHMTGSDKTFDAIVYGTGDEGAKRKAAGQPINTRPITAELGNVTPVIVVPGPWSDADIAHHAEYLASMLVNNAGFNCIAARTIITHASWNRRGPLLDAIRDQLRAAEERVPYYPGARDRWQAFIDEHPEAEAYGQFGPDKVPFTFIPNLDPSNTEDICFRTEAFCGVFSEVGLDAPRSVPDFLDQAVAFANDTVWGSLSASIIIHPRSLEDPATAAALERAIDNLRYGSVVVNHWSAIPYGVVSLPWGPYPGATNEDIQSGRGVVHNTFLVEDVEKCVLRGPFRPPLKPLLFHSHRTLGKLAPLLCEWEATQDLKLLPRMMYHVVRA